MKVLVAAAASSTEISGVQRHALNLVRCLLMRREVEEVHLVVSSRQWEIATKASLEVGPRLVFHTVEIGDGPIHLNLWYYRKLPRMAKSLDVDLVHLTYPVPVNAKLFSCPVVATLHDLYPYEIPMNFGFPKWIVNRMILRQCLKQVDSIACVSDTTREMLGRYVSAKLFKKSLRIYNCVEQGPLPAAKSPIAGWSGEPFLLCVAQHRRNKNLPLLIRALHQLLTNAQVSSDTRLVIVGIQGPETPRIVRMIDELGLSNHVHRMEGLSEAELQWFYRHCACLVIPSSTEGFGLPVAEGLLAGCTVVCSDIRVFHEIGGRACRFFVLDGKDPDALARAIQAVLRTPPVAAVELPQFSAETLSAQYVELYRGLLESRAARPFKAELDELTSERITL